MKFLATIVLFFLSFQSILKAQNYSNRFNSVDIKHYNITIEVNDSTNSIDASMTIDVSFKKLLKEFQLDLDALNSDGTGMKITAILNQKDSVPFVHSNEKITIPITNCKKDSLYTYTINYFGVPKDGLVIGKNNFGDRTFFGDNWPNRAHYWFPCIDHPSDKATIEYHITAPNQYQVVANGLELEKTSNSNGTNTYFWNVTKPIPTKVMVIGIAKFAVKNLGETHQIPVSLWVYPQTKKEGFEDFASAKDILDFFIKIFGEYPYQKLANVQSSTRYGGMENAGAIFYYEQSVTGKKTVNNLIAHEIAHQWFGNTVSEIDWPHLWLSEGFATYLTDYFILKKQGDTVFKQQMQKDRTTVLNFYKRSKTPVIDTSDNLMSLLNANSYQKGAWILYMLNQKLGDAVFWKGLKTYYKKFKYKNASSSDFKKIMEDVSGKNLTVFFNQWLTQVGHPILKTSWIYFNNEVRIIIDQTQKNAFQFPIDIELIYADGSSEIKTIQIIDKTAPYKISAKSEVKKILLDPNIKLLFESANK